MAADDGAVLMIDLSFMYSYHCDLRCSFCMYDSRPDRWETMDLPALDRWLGTVLPRDINSVGFYGGEPSLFLPQNTEIIRLLRKRMILTPKFVITNGTWSTDPDRTREFLLWCGQHRVHIKISGTPEHRAHQNREVLEALKAVEPEGVTLKGTEENLHAMGRAADLMDFSCTRKCVRWDKALRLAVTPEGDILYQCCDGDYPVLGNIREDAYPAIWDKLQRLRRQGFSEVCPYFDFASPK